MQTQNTLSSNHWQSFNDTQVIFKLGVIFVTIGTPKSEFDVLEDLYDDRYLWSGTKPADSLKLWVSFSAAQRDNFIEHIKKLGRKIESPLVIQLHPVKKLHQF